MNLNKKLFFSALLAHLILVGCASENHEGEKKTSTPIRHSANGLKAKGAVPKATADSLIQSGIKAYNAKEFSKSYDYFITAANEVGGGAKYFEGMYWGLRSAAKLNRNPEVVEMADILLKNPALTDGQVVEIANAKEKAYELGNDNLGALRTLLFMTNHKAFLKERELLKLRIVDFIQAKFSQDDLRSLINETSDDVIKARCFLRLGEMALDNRDIDVARSLFGRAISASPTSEPANRATEIINQMDSVKKVEPKTVGVVLPMTGKYAAISSKALRGIQMGLGLYGANQTSFKLAIVDSEGNPDNARRGVEKLVKEDNAIAVIGSILSKTAPAVAAKANELGVPSIALSQKYGVTDFGKTVFRNAVTSEMQVRSIVKTAMEDLHCKRFAILFPNDAYGVEYANLFWDEVLARGGSITGAQIYSNKETDFRDPIQRLVGTYFTEGRGEEYRTRYKEWSDAQTKKTGRTSPPDDLLPPVVDFDAVFIPDSAKSLGQISAMFAFNNVKDVKFLGTNLWNVPGLVKRVGNAAESVYFVDSVNSGDSRFSQSSFVKDYRNEFSEDPGAIEAQAYDAALMIRQLVSQGATSREALTESLAHLKDFPGALGGLSMTEDREVLRPINAFSIVGGNIVPFGNHKNF